MFFAEEKGIVKTGKFIMKLYDNNNAIKLGTATNETLINKLDNGIIIENVFGD